MGTITNPLPIEEEIENINITFLNDPLRETVHVADGFSREDQEKIARDFCKIRRNFRYFYDALAGAWGVCKYHEQTQDDYDSCISSGRPFLCRMCGETRCPHKAEGSAIADADDAEEYRIRFGNN
jgi:hypothetical protein